MESSQLRKISIIGLSVLCLSPVDFFSNKLFENRKGLISNTIIATNNIKLEPNYLSNNYEIFNPNIATTSNNIEKLVSENKKKEISDSENNLESKTAKENNKDENNKDENNKENNKDEKEKIEAESEESVSSISTEVTQIEANTAVTETVEPTENEIEIQAQTVGKPNTDVATSLVNYALQFVGNPYSYGGSSLYNGTDCSGFTMKIFENFGYSLPHSAEGQSYLGSYVSLDNLEPGDLIFYGYDGYICHVAIYIGNGTIIHAATSGQGITTANYQIMPIISARRILN